MSSWPPTIDGFSCVEFKREAQAAVQRESSELGPAEEIARINRSAAQGPFRGLVARRRRRAVERKGDVA